ncbi:MAG: YdeI/OmpD-associated family protein [bacterium]|nr:YdeI/OmpD-associated family protein [bacterium]
MAEKRLSGGTVHRMPQDIREALMLDKKACVAWEERTPLARNEWICWVISVKKAETRKEHLRRLVSELKEGVRRPCCWIGCVHRTDKPVSPSVWAMLDRKT